MAGTGLQQILEVIFAGNTVCHILSGKAVAQAIRGHLLLDCTLHTLLVSNAFESTLSPTSEDVPLELSAIADLYHDLLSGKTTVQEVESSDDLQFVHCKLQEKIQAMESKYLTTELWLQYMEMISIMMAFIRSERLGDWSLHLATLQKMLPYLAASGHNLFMCTYSKWQG